MARKLTSGGETQGFDGGAGGLSIEGTAQTSGASTVTFDTGTKRTGAASFKCVAAASGGAAVFWVPSSPVTALGNTLWFRQWMFFTSITGLPFSFLGEIDDTSLNLLLAVTAQAGSVLQLWNGHTSALFGSTSVAITTNVWHRIDMILNVPASGNGTASLILDGTTVTNAASQNFGNVAIGLVEAGITFANGALTCWVDDVAANDSTGANENGLPGAGGVVHLNPTADSARTGVTAGAGGTTNLWDAVNNTPPVGLVLASATNTSQIKDGTSNTTDNYQPTLQTYTAAGVTGTVVLAQPFMSHGNSTTTSRTNGIQSISNPTISEVTGATGTTAAGTWPTGWTTLLGNIAYAPTVTAGTAPVLEFRKGTASTDSAMAASMGMLVEFLPNSSFPESLTASQGQSVSLARQVLRKLSASQTSSISKITQPHTAQSLSQAQSPVLVKQDNHPFTVAQGSSPLLIKSPRHTVTLSQGETVTRSAQSNRALSILQGQTLTRLAQAGIKRSLSQSSSVLIAKTANRTVPSIPQVTSETLIKQDRRTLSVSEAETVAVTQTHGANRTLSISQAETISLARSSQIARSISQGTTPSLIKQDTHALTVGSGIYSAMILADVPTAAWRTDSTTSTESDVTGNGHNGTYTASPTLSQPGALANDTDTAVKYNGSTQYMSAPFSAALNTTNWSFEMWVKLTSLPGGSYFLASSRNSNTGWILGVTSTVWEVIVGTGAGLSTVTGGTSVANQWVYLAATYNGTTLRLYVNGLQVNSGTPAFSVNTSTPIYVAAGSNPAAPGAFAAATIDEPAAYNYALTPTQVLNHYVVGSGRGIPQTTTLASAKQANRTLSASESTSATLARSIGRTITATQSESVSLPRSVQVTRSATQAEAVTLRRINAHKVALSQAQIASLIKSPRHALSLSQGSAASRIVSAHLYRVPIQGTAASVAHARTKFIVVTQATSPSLTRGLQHQRALAVAQGTSASVRRALRHQLATTVHPSANVSKLPRRVLRASQAIHLTMGLRLGLPIMGYIYVPAIHDALYYPDEDGYIAKYADGYLIDLPEYEFVLIEAPDPVVELYDYEYSFTDDCGEDTLTLGRKILPLPFNPMRTK